MQQGEIVVTRDNIIVVVPTREALDQLMTFLKEERPDLRDRVIAFGGDWRVTDLTNDSVAQDAADILRHQFEEWRKTHA